MNPTTLSSFVSYCEAHPEQRFWQALRNWANGYYKTGVYRVLIDAGKANTSMQDTFEMD